MPKAVDQHSNINGRVLTPLLGIPYIHGYEAYRANRNNKPRFVSWEKLHEQFGAEYSRMTDFQQKARAALACLCAIDPAAPLNYGSPSSP
ncbi:MAG: hypothetical protein LC776_11890 [Acidobacteria bacterium]|nr:hypothetical protein [Acidobacteriota bacterium]